MTNLDSRLVIPSHCLKWYDSSSIFGNKDLFSELSHILDYIVSVIESMSCNTNTSCRGANCIRIWLKFFILQIIFSLSCDFGKACADDEYSETSNKNFTIRVARMV